VIHSVTNICSRSIHSVIKVMFWFDTQCYQDNVLVVYSMLTLSCSGLMHIVNNICFGLIHDVDNIMFWFDTQCYQYTLWFDTQCSSLIQNVTNIMLWFDIQYFLIISSSSEISLQLQYFSSWEITYSYLTIKSIQ
jgi:hypothetical protein